MRVKELLRRVVDFNGPIVIVYEHYNNNNVIFIHTGGGRIGIATSHRNGI